MRPSLVLSDSPRSLRRRLDRLTGLPLRPDTARLHLEPSDPAPESGELARRERRESIDPGWALLALRVGVESDPLLWVSEHPWWRGESDALGRLWRQGVAAGCAARRLAVETGQPAPERCARIALLHHLGLWAIAAEVPELLVHLFTFRDLDRRREEERKSLGIDASALGRELAERWSCEASLADAAWLHSDHSADLGGSASDPILLSIIQKAHAWAEKTPWALSPSSVADPGATDPRLRLLVAEVQVRCAGGLVGDDASPHEERVSRAHAALLRRVATLESGIASRDRFLGAFAASRPGDPPAEWAESVARAWCDEPGVTAARIVLSGQDEHEPLLSRPPSESRTLGPVATPMARLLLWRDPAHPVPDRLPILDGAWNAWAVQVADRDRLTTRLETAVTSYRHRLSRDERSRPLELLDALAEFAAGAGHELNNPLAVILGRAQLLLTRAQDPDIVRSLRAIVSQAQRAHRILRDLMYVARPPAPRPRPCPTSDVLRSSLRDFQADAESRGVRLVADIPEGSPWSWADPDPIRQLADVLIRNALEATPTGGSVRVSSDGDGESLRWSVRDSGRGVDPSEGRHLLDPFYCGRQAGRGLGMGLSRAGRFVSRAGGDLSWKSTPGQGSTFQIRLPLDPAPEAAPCGKNGQEPLVR